MSMTTQKAAGPERQTEGETQAPAGPDQRVGVDSSEEWADRWPPALTLLSILGVATYAGLRLAYSGFYDRLGVSPEELGLGQFDLLVRSIGLIALTGMAAVALAVFIVLFAAAMAAATGASRLVNWMLGKAPHWGPVVLIVSLAAWFGGVAFLPGWLRQYLPYAILAAVLLAAPLAYLVFPDLRGKHVEQARTMMSRFWFVGGVVVGALSVASIAAITVVLAPAAAQAVEQGRSYRDWTVPWRGDPATVVWLQPPAAKDPLGGHCLMYLGQANGIDVLYDVDAHRSVRVASASVVVLIDSSGNQCKRA